MDAVAGLTPGNAASSGGSFTERNARFGVARIAQPTRR
jgi:hypothetical protein